MMGKIVFSLLAYIEYTCITKSVYLHIENIVILPFKKISVLFRTMHLAKN